MAIRWKAATRLPAAFREWILGLPWQIGGQAQAPESASCRLRGGELPAALLLGDLLQGTVPELSLAQPVTVHLEDAFPA